MAEENNKLWEYTPSIDIEDLPVHTWKCWFDKESFRISDKPPNLFHRLMQRLILGFVWERIK